MARPHVKTMHDIVCRGCGVGFQNHNRNRAYCSSSCRLLYQYALSRRCWECGTDEHPAPAAWGTLDVKIAYENDSRDFAERHAACRRKTLADDGRGLTCDCKACRADLGLAPIGPQFHPKTSPSRDRSQDYRKHAPEVYARDQWLCQICGLPTLPDAHPSDDMYPTLDHIDRATDGGSDAIENLRTAHRWCNIKREGAWMWNDDATISAMAQQRFAARLIEP